MATTRKIWFVFCHDDVLLRRQEGGYVVPSGLAAPVDVGGGATVHRVTPMMDGTEVRTLMTERGVRLPQGYMFVPFRKAYDILSSEMYAKAGKCKEILFWDAHTKFCGVCGGRMERSTDISKRCTACGWEVWPQLATAIIVLIYRGDEILLVRSRNFSGNYYGLVAGFVETGETLEEAVEREVREETGLRVKDVRYVMSQPWPYPCGLMVGYTAEYAGGELVLQEEELADGGWYGLDALPPLPHRSGAAYRMINYYRQNKRKTI